MFNSKMEMIRLTYIDFIYQLTSEYPKESSKDMNLRQQSGKKSM